MDAACGLWRVPCPHIVSTIQVAVYSPRGWACYTQLPVPSWAGGGGRAGRAGTGIVHAVLGIVHAGPAWGGAPGAATCTPGSWLSVRLTLVRTMLTSHRRLSHTSYHLLDVPLPAAGVCSSSHILRLGPSACSVARIGTPEMITLHTHSSRCTHLRRWLRSTWGRSAF